MQFPDVLWYNHLWKVNYRGISLLSIVGKVFAKIILSRLQSLANVTYLFSHWHNAFSLQLRPQPLLMLETLQYPVQRFQSTVVKPVERVRLYFKIYFFICNIQMCYDIIIFEKWITEEFLCIETWEKYLLGGSCPDCNPLQMLSICSVLA